MPRSAGCCWPPCTFGCHADDPAGNSFVEGPEAAAGKDPLLSVEHYDRTPEQTREIGLSMGAEDSTATDGPTSTGRVVREAARSAST